MAGSGRTWTSAALVAAVITLGGAALTTSAASPGASSFVPITPCRLFDTRTGLDNVGPRDTPIQSNETYTVPVWGTNGDCTIPTGATGVTMNVAIVNPTGNSFLTVFPGDASKPLAANLNWVTGQAPTPNAVTAALGADGTLSFYNLTGTVDLAVDINGYYEAASGSGTGPQGPPGDPGPQPAQIVWVAKSGGDFTSVNAALASITDASASKRYVIRVAPGEYVETPITLEPYVDIVGSGPATVLTCACGSLTPPTTDASSAFVRGSGSTLVVEVRDLVIRNTGGSSRATAVRTIGTFASQVVFRGVRLETSGAQQWNYGAYLFGGATLVDSTVVVNGPSGAEVIGVLANTSSPTIERTDVSVVAIQGDAFGIRSESAGLMTLDDVDVSVTGATGSDRVGLHVPSGAVVADEVDLSLSGGSSLFRHAVRVTGGSLDIEDSTLGIGAASGLFVGDPATVTVRNSRIIGSSFVLNSSSSGATITIFGSTFEGTTSTWDFADGTYHCADSVEIPAWTAVSSNCT